MNNFSIFFFHGHIILIDHDHWSRYICYNYKHKESKSNDDCIYWLNMKIFVLKEKPKHHDHHIYDRALFQFVNYSLHFVWWYKIEIGQFTFKKSCKVHILCHLSWSFVHQRKRKWFKHEYTAFYIVFCLNHKQFMMIVVSNVIFVFTFRFFSHLILNLSEIEFYVWSLPEISLVCHNFALLHNTKWIIKRKKTRIWLDSINTSLIIKVAFFLLSFYSKCISQLIVRIFIIHQICARELH